MAARNKNPDPLFDPFRHKKPEVRLCEWPDCSEEGQHRAPKSREDIRNYRWFCLEHIRIFNKSWNFFDGMNDAEVESSIRFDTTWNRPSWKLGTNPAQIGPESTMDPFGVFADAEEVMRSQSTAAHDSIPPPATRDEERAFQELEIRYPISIEEVKTQYKALVKKHHPDANKGSKSSEERLKHINEAYGILRQSFS